MISPWDKKRRIDWKPLEIDASTSMQVSNGDFCCPSGYTITTDFVSMQEASSLLSELDLGPWKWEGFAQRRRVQRFEESSENLPDMLQQLMFRFSSTTGRHPQHVVVEDYPFVGVNPSTTNAVVTTYESFSLCESCSTEQQQQEQGGGDSYCGCFVGQVCLANPAKQHMNRPKRRAAECWQLRSPNDWTDILLEPGTLHLKQGTALWDWRYQLSRGTDCQTNDRVVIVKFYKLPQTHHQQQASSPAIPVNPTVEMPPLPEVLTIVVTTSPIKSNPSTELLERTFETFALGGRAFESCPKVIVCDGCRVLGEVSHESSSSNNNNNNSNGDHNNNNHNNVSRKHANAKQALRNGIATAAQAENYRLFKEALQRLCREADDSSPFFRTRVEELPTRHGYGFALRHALQNCVETPYVCVIQHDRTFMRATPVEEVTKAMWRNPTVLKYVGMSMRSNLTYRDIFLSKYGKAAYDQLTPQVLRLPELLLDAKDYGPNSHSTDSLTVQNEKINKSIKTVSHAYWGSSQNLEQQAWLKEHPVPEGRHQLTLTPTLFWYDNTHVCQTAHYRDFVFDPELKMVARGGFVEDKLSPNIIKSVERLGLADGHARFGCYLLDDHSGLFFTGHLDGGNFMTEAERRNRSLKGRG